jgi:hypothetical protein
MQNTKIEDKSLKRCDAAYSGRYGHTFQKKAVVPFFEIDKSCVGKIVMGTGRTREKRK